MLVTLKQLAQNTANKECAIPAFNVFGYEDAIAAVQAAEERHSPVILATNKTAVEHMPIKILANILLAIAEDAKVPVCVHLDHGKDYETVATAVLNGYPSVMYDGSQLPLEENIRNTREIVKMAHACGVSVEAEIGSVGYSDPSMNVTAFLTEPQEAKEFAERTGVDALAVAVGTLHRMEDQSAVIQFDRLQDIQDLVGTPLVLHGSSGVPDEDLARIAGYRMVKVNIGTALRMAFGQTLRAEMNKQPNEFDRIALFQEPMAKVREAAINKIDILKSYSYFSENETEILR